MQVRVKALLAFKEITIKTVAVKQLFMLKLQQCNVKKNDKSASHFTIFSITFLLYPTLISLKKIL